MCEKNNLQCVPIICEGTLDDVLSHLCSDVKNLTFIDQPSKLSAINGIQSIYNMEGGVLHVDGMTNYFKLRSNAFRDINVSGVKSENTEKKSRVMHVFNRDIFIAIKNYVRLDNDALQTRYETIFGKMTSDQKLTCDKAVLLLDDIIITIYENPEFEWLRENQGENTKLKRALLSLLNNFVTTHLTNN